MPNSYKIGASTGNINLAVDIATVGLAASTASVLVVTGTDPSVDVASSDDATGDIPGQSIGTGTSLKGKQLTVHTTVSFTDPDPANRANQAAAIQGMYTLSGGDDGTKTYDNPDIAFNDPTADVYFIVDLQ